MNWNINLEYESDMNQCKFDFCIGYNSSGHVSHDLRCSPFFVVQDPILKDWPLTTSVEVFWAWHVRWMLHLNSPDLSSLNSGSEVVFHWMSFRQLRQTPQQRQPKSFVWYVLEWFLTPIQIDTIIHRYKENMRSHQENTMKHEWFGVFLKKVFRLLRQKHNLYSISEPSSNSLRGPAWPFGIRWQTGKCCGTKLWH